ncbi:glucose-1-phosphate thymidylyltransferase RfbA [Virgibacillus halodenitrificans]|uniref:Glucose-1-phosphate thymidylyltransferase n=1 Tax=Virgibacillus halodenitrificans TaxID=1482 RepID=A0AAC9J205_VIRHA|nr:glucose-1-phosphate thymidylyltransferase RfbA [Virgibacillus halodenitrificans]APC49234.1 glucose-1-phosphate thymidylyltransferase [Virgibacillus halodenitrificans]MCG1026743.1 glucose-1-phosphate thymidylyltransferase RfbA [Virgibacillus halodenitrificans]MCJ0930146.1 glucose-1-phosphate thymidylyltransferase RfbA [Virgibacillus halodenitrificans]MEC2161061.1 glucose-1-phosphate thymidylyltransferase RfbA [Virgibacillus halodenitrificans]MYL45861.1 glucose-1-phosphate thymidylyltransfera
MKGIILAGGSGTRLAPSTDSMNKHLLAVFDKPMIYYPLSVLMLGGIKEFMIISTPADRPRFETLLGDGSSLGISISYKDQSNPNGIPEALTISKDFIADDSVALILGDNIFYGQGFTTLLRNAIKNHRHATVFGYRVKDPQRFGVVEFDAYQKAISLEEKPKEPKSDFAVTGLYIYDNQAVELTKKLKPSNRGELEITDLNKEYLKRGKLDVELLGRGFAWMDAGTHESLFEASEFVKITQQRQGFKLACLEEIAYYLGYISREALYEKGKSMEKNDYGQYLLEIADRKHSEQYWDRIEKNPMLGLVK